MDNGSIFNTSGYPVEQVPYPSGYTHAHIIITAFFVTCLMVLIVIGNMLVCIAIATEKNLKTVQNWFIASLAVSDFLVGLLIMPFSLANELMGYWIFGTLWCEVHAAMDVFLCTASINNLCLISLDRYWSITQAVRYLKRRTPLRALFMIAFVWVVSALVSVPPLLGWSKPSRQTVIPTCSLSNDLGYVLYSAFGSFYIPAVVMVVVYVRIFRAARSRARRHVRRSLGGGAMTSSSLSDPPPEPAPAAADVALVASCRRRKVAKARERRAVLILGLIMVSFILAWLPFFLLYVTGALCIHCIPETAFDVAFWLGYCNSAFNPIIYTIFNRDFRRAFRKILFK
ncbi:ADRA2B [Cordylochernes scorpioides]|uniref:ADRA2B n=1 Tax=Cordylochernes scorpioides TaxID=51811 RepID=A0ABY6KS51_9ARAC|nr:ADRA2B [Cordylochernes scorpioides]